MRRERTIALVATVVVAAFVGVTGLLSNFTQQPERPAQLPFMHALPGESVEVTCVLRNAGLTYGWRVFTNSVHHARGCSSVDTYADRLEVHHDVGAVAVLDGPGASVDETLASEDVYAGTSVGLKVSVVKMYQAGRAAPIDPRDVGTAPGNLFFSIELEVPA